MQFQLKDYLFAILWSVFLNTIDASTTLMFTTQRTPWSHPCTPTAVFTVKEMVTVATVSTTESTLMRLGILIEKNRELKSLAGKIRNKMIFRFNDSSITSALQKQNVPGFPRTNESSSENATRVYQDSFTELSKAAVYLEQVYNDETQPKMKLKLDNLFLENISQLCELQLTLHVDNAFNSETIHRNILPASLRQMNTTYSRYTRDFLIIKRYRDLLAEHHYRYKRLKKTA